MCIHNHHNIKETKFSKQRTKNLLDLSVSNDYKTALDEWDYFPVSKALMEQEQNLCICGKKIKRVDVFINRENFNIIKLGASCKRILISISKRESKRRLKNDLERKLNEGVADFKVIRNIKKYSLLNIADYSRYLKPMIVKAKKNKDLTKLKKLKKTLKTIYTSLGNSLDISTFNEIAKRYRHIKYSIKDIKNPPLNTI